MIYVSSSCVKYNKIKDSVQELVNNDFKNIELSGGTEYYDGFEEDLFELKTKYNLNYICHNYFPPPKEHFVLNLASLNNEIYEKTLDHLRQSIDLSKKLDAKKFGLHAGFFIDIKVNEIGKKISKEILFDKEKSIERFCHGYKELTKYAGALRLYIENNVFSSTNFQVYNGEQFCMLCNENDYLELKNLIDFNLLLDVAHLKVSSNTLNQNFEKNLESLIQQSDYLHVSDNDALLDLNNKLQEESNLVHLMKKQVLHNKDFTLEVYDEMTKIKESYNVLEGIFHDK